MIFRLLALAFLLPTFFALSVRGASFRDDPEYLIDSWETEDGLPENSATAMVQRPDGYLWFGTFNGLVRFDGVQFTVFNRANTPALPDAGIVNLHSDRSGRLWVSTMRGLVALEDGQWRSFGTNEGWAGNYVRTFAERTNGEVLFTTFDGRILAFENGRLSELPAPPGEPGRGYYGAVDGGGQWWVAQDHLIVHREGQRWVRAGVPDWQSPRDGTPCLSAQDGGIWAVLGSDLIKIRQGAEVVRRPVPQPAGGIWSLAEDSRSNLWISSYNRGLFRLDPSGSVRHWTTTNGLRSLGCRFAFEDREKNLWVGTSGGGLSRFKPRRFQDVDRESLPNARVVRSVAAAREGGVWVASFDQGLFWHGPTGPSHVAVPGPVKDTKYGLAVLEDRAGTVWYGDSDACWSRRGGGDFERLALPWPKSINPSAIFEDSRGRIWFALDQGGLVFQDGRVEEVGAVAGLPSNGVLGFGEDRAGVTWLATREGVYRYENARLSEVRTREGQPIPDVLSFLAEPDGTMWMGTRAHGLARLRDGRLSRIGLAAGLPTQAIHAMIVDDLDFFWMPSESGILRAARADLHAVADGAQLRLDCQLLDQRDGLPSASCPMGQPICARDGSGRFWFATQRGVATIDPVAFRRNRLPPPVHIEGLVYSVPGAWSRRRISGASVAPADTEVRRQAPFQGPIRLPAGSFRLEIRYAALSYDTPEKVRYQTKLEGAGVDWLDAAAARTATFHQLDPGDYVFRVRAANADGIWNEAGASLALTVLPFFWQTLWFRIAAGLSLASLGGGGVLWRNRVKRRLELAEIERMRREAADRKLADERFRLAVEASPNGMILLNHQGHIILVNRQTERLFGYSPEALIGQSVDMLVPARLRGGHSGHRSGFAGEPWPPTMANGRESLALRKDGSEFPVEIGLSPIEADQGPLVLCSVVDLTEAKRAELELAQQRSELAHLSRVTTVGQLSGSLAHELNQPLGIILSNAQAAQDLLSRDPPGVGEVREILDDIVSADRRAADIIQRLRALLKRGEVSRGPLDINDLLGGVLHLIRADLIGRGVTVVCNLAHDLPAITADRVQLQQLALNLILNAADAMIGNASGNRRLQVSTSLHHQKVRASVQDEGVGLPADVESLFQPFFSTKEHGMGLGLTICRTIVSAHGGRLWAEPHPERGAIFHFELPVAGTEESP